MTVVLEHSFIVILLSGVCFFLLGLSHITNGLNEVFSSRIHSMMQKLSKSYLLSTAIGFGLTVLSQSSGAVTSMLVRLGTARVLSLNEVMGVIVGSSVGSTIIVFLFTFRIADYGLAIIIGSFLISFFSKDPRVKTIMNIFLGLGFVFYGIELIGIGGRGFLEFPYFTEFATYLKDHPTTLFVVAAVFCAMVQSSAVAIGFAMGLAQANVLDLSDILLWVIGANIGTTSVALMASIGGNYVGKQVAWANFLYRAVTAGVFLSILKWLAPLLSNVDISTATMAAVFHLGMNLTGAIIFSPFYRIGIRIIEICVPEEKDPQEFRPKFIDRENYKSASMSLAYAEREIMRLSEITLSMIRDSLTIFEEYDREMVSSLRERDSMVDLLYREIKMYLVRDVPTTGSASYNRMLKLIFFSDDLEIAGDVVDGTIIDLARKKHELKLEFSEEGWKELRSIHVELMRLTALAVQQFFSPDLAADVKEAKREFRKLEMKIRESHIERLNEGLTESIKTSSIHLDLLSEFGRLAALLTRHQKYS